MCSLVFWHFYLAEFFSDIIFVLSFSRAHTPTKIIRNVAKIEQNVDTEKNKAKVAG
jgi:hypothetical protein